MNRLERRTIEGDSPLTEIVCNSLTAYPSKAGHVKSCLNLRGPSRKAKYYLATDSELVPRGKGEKNPCEGSEIVPETISLQCVGAGSIWPLSQMDKTDSQ